MENPEATISASAGEQGSRMRYRNTTYALVEGLRDVLEGGHPLTVRGEAITELRNHVIVVERPRERCIVTPERHNNIFATVAETMWVLAGRRDLEFLSHYLPRAQKFSDDEKTWRAAYGPRLRDWGGVDQVWETLRLLRNELNSRRAVMSIFDPAADFVESNDIPCNNWLHWLVREGRLHLNVAIRSNDIVWGFSGINAFEWSVLQELMAFWLGVEVGELTFFASSFHLYERHERRARTIVQRFPGTTCYEYGIESPQFATAWDDFDRRLSEWFALEARARRSPESLDDAIAGFADPLQRHFLELIQLYNGKRRGWPIARIDERLAALPETDLTTAAYEYFHRRQPLRPEEIPQPTIARYWARYIAEPAGDSVSGADVLRRAIIGLHARKTAAYGPAWKRRGEQISILANIARKVDRLEHVTGGAPATRDETVFDTAIDLFVYCVKYQTYLADVDDGAADLFGSTDPPIRPPYSDGLDGFDHLVAQTGPAFDAEGPETDEAVGRVLRSFGELETCFPEGGGAAEPAIRLERASRLTDASIDLINALRRAEPVSYRRFLTLCLEGDG